MSADSEIEHIITSLAVKAFVEKPDGTIALLIAQDPNGNYFWDLPGGGIRQGTDIARSVIDKLNQEIPNLDIKDLEPRLFIHKGDIKETTLGRKISGHDILFTGINIKVGRDFEPKLSEHLGIKWVNKKEFSQLPGGDGTLNSPTLNPWLRNLTETHFQENGLPFHYK